MERFEVFSTLIAKINRNVRKLKADQMAKYNLRSTHVQYIYHLYTEKSLSLKKLAEICIADKSAVSRGIEELQSLGYVTASDKHQYRLSYSLTKRGEDVGRELSERIDSVIEAVGKGISQEERAAFYRMLTIISENLQTIANDV